MQIYQVNCECLKHSKVRRPEEVDSTQCHLGSIPVPRKVLFSRLVEKVSTLFVCQGYNCDKINGEYESFR